MQNMREIYKTRSTMTVSDHFFEDVRIQNRKALATMTLEPVKHEPANGDELLTSRTKEGSNKNQARAKKSLTQQRHDVREMDAQDKREFDKLVEDIKSAPTTLEDDAPIIEQGVLKHEKTRTQRIVPVCRFTEAQQVSLLEKYYDMARYRGAIFTDDGEKAYTLDTMATKKEDNLLVESKGVHKNYTRKDDGYDHYPNGQKYKSRRAVPFNLRYSLRNHVTGGHNFGMYFKKKMEKVVESKPIKIYGGKMVAFELDSPAGAIDTPVQNSTRCLLKVIYALGLTPFFYCSGGKGYHIEIFFDSVIETRKLNTLNHIILTKHTALGGGHIDGIYPSNKAYRIFGCLHWKTGNFTNALALTTNENGKSKVIRLDYADSWEHFAKTPLNSAALVDEIIAANPDITTPPEQDKKAIRHNLNYAPKPVYYDLDIVQRIYETGLYDSYTRYFSVYQCREVL